MRAFSESRISRRDPGVRPLAGSEVEKFPDGSTGRKSEFRGAEGSYIACYLRRPKGPGPFPVVVILQGNAANIDATHTFGRDRPPCPAFVAAGWAVFAIDFRQIHVPVKYPTGRGSRKRRAAGGGGEASGRVLRANGKEVELYTPDNAPHGFHFASPEAIQETEEAARRAVAFIRKQFDR